MSKKAKSYRYRDTDFKKNRIGIDPKDCGCTDCIVGNSIPVNEIIHNQDAMYDIANGRKVVYRGYSKIFFTIHQNPNTKKFTGEISFDSEPVVTVFSRSFGEED